MAVRAGVGRGTVSRVLNDSPNVAPETLARVRLAIAELQFVPNPVGRQLSLGRTMLIGVIAPFLTRPSVVERLRGVAATLAPTAFDMIAFDVETAERRDPIFRDVTRRHRLDGLIVISLRPHALEVDRLLRAGVPCVLVDTHHPRLPRVVVDDALGGRLATRHLIELGHRRIAFLGDLPNSAFSFSSSRLRSWGFRRALVEAGLPFEESRVATAEHSRTMARDLAVRLLSAADRPTGIVCASDTQAFGVLEAAHSLRLAVPADLSVVGYDDIDPAIDLDLTTIRQPLRQSGARGAAILLDMLAGLPVANVRETLAVELVVRGSTAPPR